MYLPRCAIQIDILRSADINHERKEGDYYAVRMVLYAKIKRSKIGAVCKKKRYYANLEAPLKRWLLTLLCIKGYIIDMC